ncbi:MAG: outer membrane beta-barrel domain-containing protein [Cellvibrionaceae bacterium]|nr:outer membrane beta-barrel domain-containing protein [Cellvibrionaceae bacterium]
MDTRFQHIFLSALRQSLWSVVLLLGVSVQAQSDDRQPAITSEFIELGASLGVINLENFPSATTRGLDLRFRATEDLFLEFNFLQTSEVNHSAIENDQGVFFSGRDRVFKHYDLLLGYNLFQGEFFTGGTQAHLSALYIVSGVGETVFGDEKRFTYTLGLGHQLAFKRRYIWHVDMRDYIYTSSLILPDQTTHNLHLSMGMRYLF